ncbi:hypothetical protein H2O73_01815 [Vibrio sp. 404]|uniref:Uncharacterized protein n=1 Tax=Vibrio marinisediminis TaxID=2758441 RepID=A0A7W2IS82_9VIBR|nr:hypothetical protein [Vibrio marinisediminis]MBA5761064.1 hypothetical protein [Vibrio marinisediminis]
MNRRKLLVQLIINTVLSCGLLSFPTKADTNIILENGLTFFSDGTQIIQNEHTSIIKFNDGRISDDVSVISKYLKNSADITRVLKTSDNIAIDFNRLIIARENTGLIGYDGTEVTIVYGNTGKPIESYDSKGEIRKFIYDNNGELSHTDSSIFGLKTIVQ